MLPPQAELAHLWIEHLNVEEQALTATREALSDLIVALRGPSATVALVARRLTWAAAEMQNLDAVRIANRMQAKHVLNLPFDQITISTLAAKFPIQAADFRARQQRLRDLHAEIVGLSHRVATTLIYCRSFTRRILAEMVGQETAVDRYGSLGQRLDYPLTGVVQGAV